MKLHVTRCSQPSMKLPPTRVETSLAMYSLYDADAGKLYMRSTPPALEYDIRKRLGTGEFGRIMPVTLIYRFGKTPEGVEITLGDFHEWLVAKAIPMMQKARQDMKSPPSIPKGMLH